MTHFMRRRALLLIVAGLAIVLLTTGLTHLFFLLRFDDYVRRSCADNYQSYLEQFAQRLDFEMADLEYTLNRIEQRASLLASKSGKQELSLSKAYQSIEHLISRLTSSQRINAIYLNHGNRWLLTSNGSYSSFRSWRPLADSALIAQLEEAGGEVLSLNGESALLLPESIAGSNLLLRLTHLDDGHRVLIIIHLKDDWLQQVFSEDLPLRLTDANGRTLMDTVPTNSETISASCANGWTLEWAPQSLLSGFAWRSWPNLLLLLCLALTVLFMLPFLRHKDTVSLFYLFIAVALPALIYSITHFTLLYNASLSLIAESRQVVFEAVQSNVEYFFAHTQTLICNVMFDPVVYSKENLDEPDVRLTAIRIHLNAADSGAMLRMYDENGRFLFETVNETGVTPPNKDFPPLMINTMLQQKPVLTMLPGKRSFLTYVFKLYDLKSFETAGFFTFSLPESELTQVISASSLGLNLFVTDSDGVVISCRDVRFIGQKFPFQGSSFTAEIAGTHLNLVATVSDEHFLQSNLFSMGVSTAGVALATFLLLFLFTYFFTVRQLWAESLRSNMLKSDQRLLEIQVLQAQISPHFLCNTLETIRCLADDGQLSSVSRMLKLLSSLFKNGITRSENLVSLEQEITYAQAYVQLMNVRFDNRIHDEWHIEDGLTDKAVLRLILQPIVENSIRHTLHLSESLTITITAETRGNDMILSIADNGVGIPAETLQRLRRDIESAKISDHIGLINVARRIRLFYGAPYGLSIDSVPGGGTTVFLILPRRTSNDEVPAPQND